MSKKSLDLEYMMEAVKVKTGVRAGAAMLYGVWPPYQFALYSIDPALEVD